MTATAIEAAPPSAAAAILGLCEPVYFLSSRSDTWRWLGPQIRTRPDVARALADATNARDLAYVARGQGMDDWSQLLARAQDGDKAAYRRFLIEIVPFLRSLAYRDLGASSAVEDVVQETLISIHQVRHTYDPSRPVRPWLAAIAHRRCQDHFRVLARQRRDSEALAEQPATSVSTPAADAAALGQAIERLPPTQRLAIRRLKIEGLSLAELSEMTGLSIGALKAATHRGMAALKRILRNSDD